MTLPTLIDSAQRPDLTPLIKDSETVGKVMPRGAVVTSGSTPDIVDFVDPLYRSIINGRAAITADMALRLAVWLKTEPESWLATQAA